MIVRSQPGLREILFAFHGTILAQILPRILVIGATSAVAVIAAEIWPGMFAQISAIPFALIGISLSIFLSFRNNACYDRWWEGRKLWGSLIITCRSLARQTSTLDEDDRRLILRGLCAFTLALTARLRRRDDAAVIDQWCGKGLWSAAPNPPDALLMALGRRCLQLAEHGRINPMHYTVLEGQLTALSQVQAACERIMTTPLPFTYSLILHRTTYTFCLLLPFALAGSLGWWTMIPVLLVSYPFFGLDALGDQLEDPFGLAPNDLPLDAMSRMVEREMLFLLGEEPLPAPLEPVRHILT